MQIYDISLEPTVLFMTRSPGVQSQQVTAEVISLTGWYFV
jgi:hypothetical protein